MQNIKNKFGLLRNNKSGFTLIEMLVVIAIIAILSGVVIVGVNGFQSRARDTRSIADIKNIQNYLELYFNSCGRYPGGPSCAAGDPASWSDLVTAMSPLMGASKFPQSQTVNSYCYGVTSDGLNYVIGSVLENGNSVTKENVDLTKFTLSGGNTNECTGKTNVYWVSS